MFLSVSFLFSLCNGFPNIISGFDRQVGFKVIKVIYIANLPANESEINFAPIQLLRAELMILFGYPNVKKFTKFYKHLYNFRLRFLLFRNKIKTKNSTLMLQC